MKGGFVRAGRRHRLEELISRILGDLRKHAEKQFERPIRNVVVGRLVRFVGSESDEDDLAMARLREAFQIAGFEQVDFELEPVAAAYSYESTLDHDERILIGDFGGGTSDFSLLRVGPEARKRGHGKRDMLGYGGVGLAGDAFDARIVRRVSFRQRCVVRDGLLFGSAGTAAFGRESLVD